MAEEYDDTKESILKAKEESSNCYQCDSAIFDLDLPSVEKLTFIALTRYFTSARQHNAFKRSPGQGCWLQRRTNCPGYEALKRAR